MNEEIKSLDALKEAVGGVFTHKTRPNCFIYCMEDLMQILFKPELLDRLYIDLKELRKMSEELEGRIIPKVPLEYQTITTKADLVAWLDKVKDVKVFSVDCEWSGTIYATGKLRYIQFCWGAGKAMCLKFRDETSTHCNELSYSEASHLLAEPMNKPEMRWIGHNISADSPWMLHFLNIRTYKKVIFDTMYAIHTLDENADLKLERLALRCTDLGRYDIELIIWKKENKLGKDEGYERVPDAILEPYSMKDVDTVFRSWPILMQELIDVGDWNYYLEVKLPFVTDCFTDMHMTGIPVNKEDIEIQRDKFVFVRDMLEKIFKETITNEARLFILQKLTAIKQAEAGTIFAAFMGQTDPQAATLVLKKALKRDYAQIHPFVVHYFDCPDFNHKSSDNLRNWLYVIKGYTPIKSTKREGQPSTAWEKVLNLPEAKQKDYAPSTDKDTLKIFAELGDDVLNELMDLKAIGTITRTFLRPDDEAGNKEGLHKYICEDLRVRTSFMLTDTNRPRSIRPNILNIPKYLALTIEGGFAKVQKYFTDKGEEPPAIVMDPKPLRWNFKAEDGYCFTESDYKTAEVFAIAWIAGDKRLMKVLTEPDAQFGFIPEVDKDTGKTKNKQVRLSYLNTDITEDAQNPKYLHPLDDPNLMRDEEGELIHPRRDVHWELAECRYFMNKPREELCKDLDRGCGKAGNFQVPYQASGSLLERVIYVNTGIKPPEGTGDRIIEAYTTLNAVCGSWLEEQLEIPEEVGISEIVGAKRHYHIIKDKNIGLNSFQYSSMVEPLKRKACNWKIQTLNRETIGVFKLGEFGENSRVWDNTERSLDSNIFERVTTSERILLN